MRVLARPMSSSALPGVALDMLLCFAAMMLAASSLTNRYATIPRAVAELPLVLGGSATFAVVMALMYGLAGLYRPNPIRITAVAVRTVMALAIGAYVTALAMRSVADRGYVEQLIPAAIVYLGIGMLIVRGGIYIAQSTKLLPRTLIVGTDMEAFKLANELRASGRAIREVVGLLSTGTTAAALEGPSPDWRIFPRGNCISQLIQEYGIDEIVVAVQEQRGGSLPMDELLACRISGVPVLSVAAFVERTRCEVPVDSLKGSWLIYGDGFVQGWVRQSVKRMFDIVGAAILLLLLWPLMLLTAFAIRLEGKGPILYRQQRVGLDGKLFTCTKFRSMRCDAERDGVARWAEKNDRRVTVVGSVIRKSRIDELPQLWSVVCGDMSLVGPRPERPVFVESLKPQIPFYDLRHTVKPGLTGWAQVRYHYGGSIEDARRKHQFDLYYIKNNSLWLDLLILIETFSVVALSEGQ